MGQAADSFWLDILGGFQVSTGFLSVDRPVVVRRGDGGVAVALVLSARLAEEKKKVNLRATAPEKKVGRAISLPIGHLIDAVPARAA